MANPKNNGRSDAPAAGFEALDAKAEALEAQAVEIESQTAELMSEDIAPPVVEAPPELAPPAEALTSAPPAAPPTRPAGVEGLLGSALRCGQSAMQLQVEALGALGRARGPQDILAVQVDLTRKLLDVYVAETASAAASLSGLFTRRAAGAAQGVSRP